MFQQDETHRPPPGTALCDLEDIVEGGAKGFRWGDGPSAYRVFLLRWDGQVHAYVDSCPHLGTPLAYLPDKFLTEEGEEVLCSTHGARFLPQSGLCVSGPCEGKSLEPFPISLDGNKISVGTL